MQGFVFMSFWSNIYKSIDGFFFSNVNTIKWIILHCSQEKRKRIHK